MIKLLLVSMPYAILRMPSISIAQLKAVAEESMKGRIKLDSAHCYIDFAEFLGLENYKELGRYEGKGLNDWMFRHMAFESQDNAASYEKYFFLDGKFPKKTNFFRKVTEKRSNISAFIDGLIAEYHMADYDIIGFTSMMSQNISSFALSKRIKQINPDIITIIGGPNCDHPMGKTIVENVPQIDYVFSGEGLTSFPQFLDAIDTENFEAISDIQGVHSVNIHPATDSNLRDVLSTTSEAPGQFRIPSIDSARSANSADKSFDMNKLPMLDYNEYLSKVSGSQLYENIKGELLLPFQTSAGCWKADKFPCTFCGLAPHSFKQMSATYAATYINGLLNRYSDKFSAFAATDPCMPADYPQEVFPKICTSKQVVIQYDCRANLRSKELIQMSQANVLLPQAGIESMSTKTLRLMRKGVTAFQNVKFLKHCAEQGLYPIWNHIYGFPEKAYTDLNSRKFIDDIKTLLHLPPPSSNAPIAFHRYSEYFNNREKYGLNLVPEDKYFYIYPFREETIGNMVSNFMDREYSENLVADYGDIINEINLEIVMWMCKFRNTIPKLYFKDQLKIYDSRYDSPIEHKITQMQKDILQFMNTPQLINDISEHFVIPLGETEKFIDNFLKKRFIFTESGKYLNVVCKQCLLEKDDYEKYLVDFVKNTAVMFE